MAVTIFRRSPPMRVTSEAAIATSVPLPMAMPRSARARAGASLIPSPTMATVLPPRWRAATWAAFCSGSTSARTCRGSIPTSRAMASAVARWSPVSIQTSSPRARSWATASADPGLRVSATAIRPAPWPS